MDGSKELIRLSSKLKSRAIKRKITQSQKSEGTSYRHENYRIPRPGNAEIKNSYRTKEIKNN